MIKSRRLFLFRISGKLQRIILFFALIATITGIFSLNTSSAAGRKDFSIVNGKLVKYTGSKKIVTIPNSVKRIGDKAFANNKVIQEIKIPDTVKSIGDKAFYNCINLKTITVPGNVKTIGNMAFLSCKNLENVVLEEGIKYINDFCFSGCEQIKSITFPNTLVSIGIKAFESCKELDTVNFSKNKVDYGTDIFIDTKIYNEKKVDFLVAGDGTLLKYLGKDNKEVTIPDSVTMINHNAFTNELVGGYDSIDYTDSMQIDTVIVPGNVKEILSNAFTNGLIKTIILEEGVTTIDDCAFLNGHHYQIDNITIPDSVVSIGKDAFDVEDKEYGIVAPVITCKKDSVAYKEAMRLGLKINLMN
jgi:hypothetical protein